MKRWRRLTLIISVALLVLVLGLTGGLIWLQSSGRLTRYAQELVRQHSGQNLSFDAVALASWNVVALTNVRLQQTTPGWQLDVTCPRVEAHYTWQGLRRKQIAAVHLMQPIVHLQRRASPAASGGTGTPAALVLPVERLQVRDAALYVKYGEASYTFKPIEVSVRQIAAQHVGLEASARVDDKTAKLRITGDMSLDLAHPAGTFDVSLSQIDVSRLASWGRLPADWTLTEGTLEVVASQVKLRGQTLQGTLKINLEQGRGEIAAVTVQGATVTTHTIFAADLANRTAHLQGPMQLQATKVRQASSGLVATQLAAQLPMQLTYAPDQWHVHTDLHLQGEQIELAAAGGMQLQQLSQTASVDAQSTPQGWSLKGDLTFDTPSASIASMRLKQLTGKAPVTLIATPKQWQSTIDLSLQSQTLSAKNAFELQQLSSRLPIRITSTALTAPDAHLQAGTVRWQPGAGTPITSSLELRTSVDVNLQRQQFDATHLDLHLPNLGRLQGSGTWQWSTGTLQEVHLAITPTALETVWPQVAALLPPPSPTWMITGQSQIDLHAPRLTWRDAAPAQPFTIDWRFNGITFSSPAGIYAGEHINGQLEANVALTPDWRPVSVQASLKLKPFALLIGSFFPELEQNNITSTVTLNSMYHPNTGHVDLVVESQFGPLGHLSINGQLDTSQTPMQADVTSHLHQIDVRRAWQTFMPAALRQTAEPPDLQGWLNARLQLRGTLDKARLQGHLQLAKVHLQTGSLHLRNLSLQLPLDIQYPLPEHRPPPHAFPASAYGQLHLDHFQFGGLQIPGLTTQLAMHSDSIVFQKDMQATLLNGVLHLQDLVAYDLLRPQRQIHLQMRLRSLHLQHLQREVTELSVVGLVDADFSKLHFQNGRLDTEGSLQIEVAGGRIRIRDVTGWDLLSPIPSIQGSLKTEVPLSLLKLTEIYPIGHLGGTLHFTVDDLTITAGEPAAFRLRFHVQHKGGEERQISLQALNTLLFTTGSARVASSVADTLPYRRFGAEITLRHDTLRLRGLYKDRQGREYFMRAPALGNGVSIVNTVPQNGTPFRDFVQRLTATILEGPNVNIK